LNCNDQRIPSQRPEWVRHHQRKSNRGQRVRLRTERYAVIEPIITIITSAISEKNSVFNAAYHASKDRLVAFLPPARDNVRPVAIFKRITMTYNLRQQRKDYTARPDEQQNLLPTKGGMGFGGRSEVMLWLRRRRYLAAADVE
jgi:hypothetical protein